MMKASIVSHAIAVVALCLSASLAQAAEGQRAMEARVTVVELADHDAPVEATMTIAVIHRPPWHPNRRVAFGTVSVGEASDWVDVSEQVDAHGGVATAVIRLSSQGERVERPARVRIELRRPGGATLASTEIHDGQAVLGFEIPERGVADDELADRLRSVREIARDHVAASEPVAVASQDLPQRFVAATRPTVFHSHTDRSISLKHVQAVLNLGYNAHVNLPLDLADEAGVPYVAGADYRPPGAAGPMPEPGDEALRSHYRRHAERLLEHAGDTDRLRVFAMSDEPSWNFPHATDAAADDVHATARFRDYLRGRRVSPENVGAASWDEVRPVGPPADDASDERRRLWYHSARFISHDQSQRYAAAADALRRELGEHVLGFVNWNNPGIVFSDVSQWHGGAPVTGSHDWFEFSRAGGATALWLGPGISETGGWYRSTFRTWAMMLTLLRSAANEGVERFGAYVHHNFIPDDRGYEVALSIMAIAGHGGAGYNSYVWGPHYAFTEYMWSEKFGHYPHAADANRLIGRSEHLMVDAEPPPAEIAILWPVTSQLYELNQGGYWTYNRDYLVETQHLWLAMNHHHLRADFVDERMVQRGLDDRYRVLYVAAPHVEDATADAMADWVRAGGMLWTSARAISRNELDRPTDRLREVLGVSRRELSRDDADDFSPRGGLQGLRSMGRVTMSDGDVLGDEPWEVYGARAALEADGATVLGHFDDGSPAVLVHRVGEGESWHFAGMPGLAYGREAEERGALPTTGYPERIARLVIAPAERAGVTPPASTDDVGVEAAVLRSERGIAVTLLNWQIDPLDNLRVTIHGVDRPAMVRSARLGDVDHQRFNDDNTIELELPMPEAVDVILVEFE